MQHAKVVWDEAPLIEHPPVSGEERGTWVLDEHECLALLASVASGRIGVTISALPAIYPVTYILVDDRVLFFPGDGEPLRYALSDTVVAFQADRCDPGSGAGWNVQAVGVARLSSSAEDRLALELAGIAPPKGPESPIVAFRPARLTGWRHP